MLRGSQLTTSRPRMRFIINMHQCVIMHVALFRSPGETVRRDDSCSPLVSTRSVSKNASRILVYTPRKPSAASPRRYSDRALVPKTTGPQSLKPSDYIVQQGISYQTLQDICCNASTDANLGKALADRKYEADIQSWP